MASKSAHIVGVGLLFMSLSAHAEDGHQAHHAAAEATTVNAEIIVVAQRAVDETPFQLAMEPVIADPQDLILENLAKRLSSADKPTSKGSLDI